MLLSYSIKAFAEPGALTAQEIAKLSYNRDEGDDYWMEAELTLTDSDGREKIRKLVSANKKSGENSKRYIKFTEPGSIKGTALLSYQEAEEPVQFIYLPSVGRSRRVTNDLKDRQFASTDFTYEDLEKRSYLKDSYKLIKEESLLGKECWVLEKSPLDKASSQYEMVQVWIDKKHYIPLKLLMFKKGSMVKSLTVNELKEIQGIWTATDFVMYDHESEHRTRNKIITIKYNSGVKDEVFTPYYLEKEN